MPPQSLTIQDIRKISQDNQVPNLQGYDNVFNAVKLAIRTAAEKGNYTTSVDITNLVSGTMPVTTSFAKVASCITKALKEEGYEVSSFSHYKEESLAISW